MKRSIGFFFLVPASLLLGLYVGSVLSQRRFAEGSRILSQVLALKEYETLAGLQYKESTPTDARQALLSLLGFMESLEAKKRPAKSVQRGIDLDRGIVYMRLARLEERDGNKDRSEEYIRQAQESLKKADIKDVSESHLRDVITQLDATTHYLLPYTLTFTKSVQ
jgi:hypothetical protein